MTSVRPRLLAAVPLLGLAIAMMPSSAPASLPDSCNGQVDVALGAPKADVSGQPDAGSVTLAFENGAGFANPADLLVTEALLGGTPAAGNSFGASVVWGFEDAAPSCSMVAVGAPGADGGAGKVYVFVVDEDGVVPSSVKVLTQDSEGIPDSAETGDNFGAALHFGGDLTVSWLAVGSPNEDVGSVADAGMVHVLPYASGWGAGSVAYSQGTSPVPGGAEAGDHFGAAMGPGRNVWSLWVGAPEEDLGTVKDAGSVVSLPGSYNTTTGAVKLPGTIGSVAAVTQDSKNVPGAPEKYDHFGAVMTGLAGTQSTDRQPVIGVPGEDVGSVKDAGIFMVAYQDKVWITYQQGSRGVSSTPETGDRFGAALAVYDTVLLIGAPGEGVGAVVGAGVVHRMIASGAVPKLSTSGQQMFSQNSSGLADDAEAGDQLGASLAFGINGAVVGAPGEDVGAVVEAGAVAYLPYVGDVHVGLTGTGSGFYVAGDPGFPGSPEAGAGFGSVAYSVTQ